MIRLISALAGDVRFGWRTLGKAPLVGVSIVLLLALGIGANAAMFGIADAVLLHAVRYPDPRSLVFVWSHDTQGQPSDVSPADFMEWRARARLLTDFAACMPTSFVVTGGERPRQLTGARVTASFFRTLRVKPEMGRTFLPDEDGLDHPENAAHSVIVSYRLWQEELGADPNVLGRVIRVDSVPYTIVGVMPRDFSFWWRTHDLWIPVTLNVHEHDYRDLVVIARLAAPRARAAAEMSSLAQALAVEFPKSDQGWTVQLDDLEDWFLNGTLRTRLLLLCGAVGLVLLIVCINVAGLLLARMATRDRELAVRISLGATRWRVAQQLLTESAMLAGGGGALGLALAWGLIRAAPHAVPAGAMPGGPIELSGAVVGFTAAVTLATCILFGVAPAWSAARGDVQSALKEASRGSTSGRGRLRFRQALAAAEVAASLMLLVVAWLMMGSLRDLARISPGFDPRNLLTLRVYLPSAKYDAAHAMQFNRAALDRIAALPGVRDAAVGSIPPTFYSLSMLVRFEQEGAARPPGEMSPGASYFAVGENYFRTYGIPLLRGRYFTAADDAKAPLVVIMNQAFAARYYQGQDPVGRKILLERPVRLGGAEQAAVLVAGVVGDIRRTDMSLEAMPTLYVPLQQNPFTRAEWLAARTEGDPLALAGAVRRALAEIDPEEPIEQLGTMERMIDNQFAQPRFQTSLMAGFALMAMLLAAVGIYGVNAYAVAQRRNEIGLRMALGASQQAVLGEVLGLGMRLIALGILAGLIGAAALTVWLRAVLVGAGRMDPLAFVGAAAVLAAVAFVACYFPARRATRIDPAVALRAD